MDTIMVWLFLSFTVERLVELLMKLVPRLHKKQLLGIDVPTLFGLAFSLVLAYGARLDFFKMFNVEFAWGLIGPFISALFMMGGSNLIHDMTEWVRSSKEESKHRMQINGKS